MPGNHKCDPECYNPECDWDGGDCSDSAVCGKYNCNDGQVGNGLCDPECYNDECKFDGGDCTAIDECAPGCLYYMRQDGVC